MEAAGVEADVSVAGQGFKPWRHRRGSGANSILDKWLNKIICGLDLEVLKRLPSTGACSTMDFQACAAWRKRRKNTSPAWLKFSERLSGEEDGKPKSLKSNYGENERVSGFLF